MARYLVLEKSFIYDRIVEAGEEVDYDGHPGANLQPLDDEAKAAKKHYDEVVNPARVKALLEANPSPDAMNQVALANLIGEAVAKALAAQNAALAAGDAAVKAADAKADAKAAKEAAKAAKADEKAKAEADAKAADEVAKAALKEAEEAAAKANAAAADEAAATAAATGDGASPAAFA